MSNSSSRRVELGLAPVPVGLDDLEHGADVVLDVQAAEDRGFLRQVADAQPGAAVHRQARDVVAVERDPPAIGRHQAGDHVEDGGLAGAVGSEQANRLAVADIEPGVLDDGPAAIALGQPFDREDTLAAPVARSCRKPGRKHAGRVLHAVIERQGERLLG